jgi:Sec-independent protein translocase protein TatA
MSFFGRDQIPGTSCSVVAAIKAIKDSARQIKNQQMGETVETHAADLLTIQLYPNHVSTAKTFKPRFEDRG